MNADSRRRGITSIEPLKATFRGDCFSLSASKLAIWLILNVVRLLAALVRMCHKNGACATMPLNELEPRRLPVNYLN